MRAVSREKYMTCNTLHAMIWTETTFPMTNALDSTASSRNSIFRTALLGLLLVAGFAKVGVIFSFIPFAYTALAGFSAVRLREDRLVLAFLSSITPPAAAYSYWHLKWQFLDLPFACPMIGIIGATMLTLSFILAFRGEDPA